MNVMPNKPILEKWLSTGLLDNLPLDQAFKLAQLLENQLQYMLQLQNTAEDDEINDVKQSLNIVFPVITRLFCGELVFTWDACVLPTMTVKFADGTLHKQSVISAKLKAKYDTRFVEKLTKRHRDTTSSLHSWIPDVEVEYTSMIAEALTNDFNYLFTGKHVVFYTPIIAMGKFTQEYIEKVRPEWVNCVGLATRYAAFNEQVEVVL